MGTTNPHAHGHGTGHGHAQQLNHETTDVTLTGVTRIGVASLIVLAVILLAVYGMYRAFIWNASDTQTLPALTAYTPEHRIPTGTALIQPDEPSALRQLRQHERDVLQRYGWVDKAQGVARIPIAKAMELVVAKPELIGTAPEAPATPDAAAAPAAAAPAAGAPATPGAATTPAATPAPPATKTPQAH